MTHSLTIFSLIALCFSKNDNVPISSLALSMLGTEGWSSLAIVGFRDNDSNNNNNNIE